MTKPKKNLYAVNDYQRGFNIACEKWENWLPDEEELESIITSAAPNNSIDTNQKEEIAKAILNRIK